MPITVNDAIEWEESNQMAWSISASAAPHTASRWGLVTADVLPRFVRAMVGYSELKVGGGVRRTVPEPHPYFPWLFARDVRFVRNTAEPKDVGPQGALSYSQVEVEIVYQSLDCAILPDEAKPIVKVATETWRYTSRNRTLAVHGQIIPRNVLEFVPVAAEAPELVPEPGSEFLSSASIKMTWWEIPCVEREGTPELPAGLRNNIDNSLACVNTDLFDDRYPRGTLLMLAPEENFRRMADGKWCCDVIFHFEQRGNTDNWDDVLSEFPSWRHVRRGSGKFQRVRRKDDPTKEIYGHFAFKDLFWPF